MKLAIVLLALAFVRLSELKSEVKAGDQLAVTLETDGGIAIPIAAVVK